jgi:hypothetical protein
MLPTYNDRWYNEINSNVFGSENQINAITNIPGVQLNRPIVDEQLTSDYEGVQKGVPLQKKMLATKAYNDAESAKLSQAVASEIEQKKADTNAITQKAGMEGGKVVINNKDSIVSAVGNVYEWASMAPEAAQIASEVGSAWAAEGAAGEAAYLASLETGSTIGTTAGATLGGTIGTVVGIAAPYYALAKAGGMAINAVTANNPWMKDTPLGLLGEGLKNPITGVERSVGRAWAKLGIGNEHLNNFIASIFNPSGIFEELGGGCIIITACTDRNSYEVGVARKYKEKFLDKDQIRGYYCIAEKFIDRLKKSKRMQRIVKKYLVDKLIDYGEYKLDMKEEYPQVSSYIITKLFLGLIKLIGLIVPQYTRTNGEVY